jgi:hypothetical protein
MLALLVAYSASFAFQLSVLSAPFFYRAACSQTTSYLVRRKANYPCVAFMTLAKSTARHPIRSTAPATSGALGIRVAMIPESRTITRIAKASEPSSTNKPTNIREAVTNVVMVTLLL